jgi:rare lipoprotein A
MACAIAFGFCGDASAAEQGLASYYHPPRSGGLIAAHRSLPKGSQVRVLNLDNGRGTAVEIVDRGPYVRGRILDVSPEAARALGFRKAGVAHVRIDALSLGSASPAPAGVSPEAICRDDADRLEKVQGAPTPAPLRNELGCQQSGLQRLGPTGYPALTFASMDVASSERLYLSRE